MAKKYAKISCNRRDWTLWVTTFKSHSTPIDIRYSSIHTAYGRPSDIKVSAYHDCCELADYLLGYFQAVEQSFPTAVEGICSKNTCMFTYGCNYYADNKLLGRLYITRTGAVLVLCDDYLQSFCDTFGVKI